MCLPRLLICLLIALVSPLLLAQSNPVRDANHADAAPITQGLSVGVGAQRASEVQEFPVSFSKTVSYNSGGIDAANGVAVGDLDGNGYPDVVVANCCSAFPYGEVGVLLNNGDGTFQAAVNYITGGNSSSVAVADVNGDGHPDLVVAIYSGIVVLLGNGDGTFQTAVNYGSGGQEAPSVAVADVNGDSYPDVIVANKCASNSDCGSDSIGIVGVLFGNGDGTFQPAVSYDSGGLETDSVAVADVNGDGYPDLIVTNEDEYQSNSVSVLLNNGNGTFQTAVSYGSGGDGPDSVAVADVNGDGYPDLIVANEGIYGGEGGVSVLLGNGDGTFQSAVSYFSGGDSGTSVAVVDVNGDGHLDLVVANMCSGAPHNSCNGIGDVGVLLGNGDGTFEPAVGFHSGGSNANSVAVADVNRDGRPDLVVSNECQKFEQGGCHSGPGVVGVLLNNFTTKTTTTVTSLPNPSLVNQAVTLTATITSSDLVPDGQTVTFYHGKTILGTGTTTNGVASLNTSFSKKGNYVIKASYPGVAFNKASSATVKQVVNP